MKQLLFTLFVFLLLSNKVMAGGSAVSWTGTVSTDWNTATNWTSNAIPVSGGTANISAGATPFMPTISSGTVTRTSNTNLTSGSLTMSSGVTWTNTSGIFGMSANTTFTNNGTFSFAVGTFTTSTTSTILGTGSFTTSTLSNTGNISPATTTTAGTLSFAGYTHTGNMQIQLGGNTQGTQYDNIAVSGTGTMGVGSTLTVTFINGFKPTLGSTYTIVNCGTCTGSFSTVSFPSGYNFSITYDHTAAAERIFLTTDVVLAVELVTFTGKNTEGGNQLTWTTANEVNNKGFKIERLSGNTWETLGFVNGNDKGATYQFTDTRRDAINRVSTTTTTEYYRLRQIDNDDKETLSKVIAIQSNGRDAINRVSTVKLYPNPASNILTIDNGGAAIDNIIVTNALGQQVLVSKQQSQIDVSLLPSGVYCVSVQSGATVVSQKVFKQ